MTEEKGFHMGGNNHASYYPLRECVKAAAMLFLMRVISSVKAKRKLDLEDPLYLPEFRTPKGKCSLAARIPSPKSEYSATDEEPFSAVQYGVILKAASNGKLRFLSLLAWPCGVFMYHDTHTINS